MHDDPFEHGHDADDERLASIAVANNPDHDYYYHENIELTTVGIDIGSSTSHLMFSKIHLQRIGEYHSSRYVVVERKTLYRSPILLTPYTADYAINTSGLRTFIDSAYAEAGYTPDDIDSGAVILTGEAVKRTNAHGDRGPVRRRGGQVRLRVRRAQPRGDPRGQRLRLRPSVAAA